MRTTPEASELQALFAVAVERGVSAVAMEVSSHALALGRVEGVRFAVGGFTNFGVDHLDFHADVDDYFQANHPGCLDLTQSRFVEGAGTTITGGWRRGNGGVFLSLWSMRSKDRGTLFPSTFTSNE